MNIYGVFIGSKWGMHSNKRMALRIAKREKGYVMVLRSVPEIKAYDAPTFRVLAELLADYREAK